MSVEANSYFLFPYSQRLAASKFSLTDLHSHCAARLVVPPSLRNSSSTPHLNSVISEDADNVDSGASRSRRYSIVSCSNDLEYISRFNQEVMKVSVFLSQNILPCYDSHSLCSSSLLHMPSSVSPCLLPWHHTYLLPMLPLLWVRVCGVPACRGVSVQRSSLLLVKTRALHLHSLCLQQ